jgi:hypothetical protein
LDFNVKAPIHREALGNILLRPWELLHGVKELALIDDIGDSMRRRLQKSILEGPFPAEAVFTVTEYHTMALREMAQENSIDARWWWSLHEDYSRYLTHLSLDPLMKHRFKDADNELWAQLWNQSAKVYFKGRLEIAKIYLHQAKYRKAVLTIVKARHEPVVPLHFDQMISPLLKSKLFLCEALAHIGLGKTNKGRDCLRLAAHGHYPSVVSSTTVMSLLLLRILSEDLQTAINKELIKLNSPYQYNSNPTLKTKARIERIDYPAGRENRSFWEWLDLPEQ